jgi:hypothetical protein
VQDLSAQHVRTASLLQRFNRCHQIKYANSVLLAAAAAAAAAGLLQHRMPSGRFQRF